MKNKIWVKTTERLPPFNKKVIWQQNGNVINLPRTVIEKYQTSPTAFHRWEWLDENPQFHSTERVMEEIGKGWDMCNANRLSPCGYPNKDEYLSYIKKELEK